jgi:two-component system, NtrC family, response regulator AtoC
MSQGSIHILVIDDDEDAGDALAAFLGANGHRVEVVRGGIDAIDRLAVAPLPDVMLLDVRMPGMDGIETLRRYRAKGGAVPVVMMSAFDEAPVVVQAMRLGANDYVTKPIQKDDLLETIERAVAARPLRASTSTSVIQIDKPSLGSLGASPAMRRVEALVDRVADADVPILITGESGVGKDVVARELHARSSRSGRVFVKINCAALPETLLESELFGYERGAFTGAQRAKPGQFELADGGTLFLDEIGEMPISLQAKLLQALQDGEFYRVGGQKKVQVDVRIIVATNRDLERAIREQTFREDLYYRLNVVNVRIPPLRERREDIPGLLALFVDRYGRRYGRGPGDVPAEVVQRFLVYDWPGNVRELENLVRRLMVLRDPSYVYAEMRMTAPQVQGLPLQAAHVQGVPIPPLAAPPIGAAPMVAPPLGAAGPALDELTPHRIDSPSPQVVAAPAFLDAPAPLGGREAMLYNPVPAMPVVPVMFPPAGPPAPSTNIVRGGSYPFGGYASGAAARPLGEVVAEEFAQAGEEGRVDLKALGR